jgi:DNA sulfur modification protein DndD
MKLNLLGWKCEGLRCPDFNIELDNNGSDSATFLQMPNGTGKTTTLRLLKRSLYKHDFKSTEIDQYKARNNEYKKEGFFQAKFSVEGNVFYTTIKFDFEKKTCSYSSSSTNQGGQLSTFKLPNEIENIVDKELVDLLFVDLELDVKPMFRSHQTGAQEAIRKFCKINLLKNIIEDFEDYKNKKRKENIKSGNIQTEINTEETRRNKILNKILEVEKKAEEYKKYLNETENEYVEGKRRLDEILENDTLRKNKIKEYELRRDNIKSKYDEILIKNFESIKSIGTYDGNLKTEIIKFVEDLDEMGLPEEEVRIFFDKILKKQNCICGELLTAEKIKIIQKEMNSFISIKEAGIITAIKAIVSENVNKKEQVDLNLNSKKIQEYKQELDALNTNIKLVRDRALKDDIELSKKIENLKKDREIKSKFLDEIINQEWKAKHNEENTESLISLKEQKRIVDKKLAELSGTKDIEEKVLKLTEIIEDAMQEAEIQISREIALECNKKINIMFVKENIEQKNPIFINSIEKNIVLDGQSEASTGQEARIGILFLLTILERSTIQFPLIVDTPVKGMDSAAKRRTAKFISELKSQFLCFVIDEDRPNFTDEFFNLNKKNSNFITAFRRSDEFDKMANLEDSNQVKNLSYNGQVIHGYNFFSKFTERQDK